MNACAARHMAAIFWRVPLKALLLFLFFISGFNCFVVAAPIAISISNPPAAVNASNVGDTQFWPNAGSVGGTPISLRATLTSISAGDTVRLFTSGDNPVVRANTGTLSSTVLWEVFDANTGLPIFGDPNFLITDIDGRNGNPIESVSAACAGLTSYKVNGAFMDGCNANGNAACETNIRVSESGGNILAEGTQNQNGNQQEGYMQFNWTGVSSWTVNYFATSGGRWYVHDADGDIPFDGTEVLVNLVEMATIKGVAMGSATSPIPGEQITFEIVMSNAGPEDATGGNLVDTLPAGLNLISANATDGSVVTSGGPPATISWSNVSVPVGVDQVLTIVAEVDSGVAPGTVLTNETSTALANESVCSSRDVLTYTFTVSEPPAPALTVAKSVSTATSFNKAGDTITYSYLVTNTGNVVINNVAPIDSGPTFNAQMAQNTLSGFSPATATLAPGESQTFTATYVLDQVDVDNMAEDANPLMGIDNTASATGMPVAGTLAAVLDSTAETGFAPMPSLTVDKVVSPATTFSKAGDTITYQYTVSNNGNITVENVSPTDVGPTFNGVAAAGTLSPFSPLSANIGPGTGQIFTATYELQQADVDNMAAAADPLTAIDNTASATGDPVGAVVLPTVADSMVETGFAPIPLMTVTKTVGTATSFSKAGDTITYEYQLQNTGNVTINNAVPTDTGPTFNGVAATNSLSAFSPSSVTLVPGAPPVTVMATYVLAQQDIDNMFAAADPTNAIENTASATGAPSGGMLPVVADSTVETGFALMAELTLTKSAGVPSIGLGSNTGATDAGDTIAYSFDVTNSGDVTIDALAINDTGPTFDGMAGSGSLSMISCPLTSLNPGQMTTCTATYTLSQGDVDNAVVGGANAVENTATASGQDPNNNPVSSPGNTANQTIAADSSIEIAKSASAPTTVNGTDPTLVDPGDTITYQLLVDNTGNTTLSNVLVSDSIAAVTCSGMTRLGSPFVNDGTAQLMVGDGIACSAVYMLQQTDLNAGGVQNTADVTSTDPTNSTVDATDSVSSGFTQKASVALIKSATPLPSPSVDGDPITYTFSLTNTGNVTLTAPQVADPVCEMPIGPLTFANGYQSGDAGVAGEMEAGETWVFECVYTIDQDDVNAGEVANTATASGTPPPASGLANPTNTASNLADAQQNAAIALDKSSSLPTTGAGTLVSATDVGDTIAYSFVVENTGNVTLSNVVVTDPLITGAPNNGNIDCPAGISSMAPGDMVTCTASYTLTQPEIDAGMLVNTASVIGTPPPSVPPSDSPEASSSNTVTIAPMPDLEVTKSVGALTAPLQATNTITYTFLIENTGNVTVNNVIPVDIGPTFNGAAASNSLSAFTPLSANLAPGDSQTFTATYALSQTDIDNIAAAVDPLTAIDNSATAAGAPENGALPTIEPSATETGAAPNPSVQLVKSSMAPAVVEQGADITYTFVLTNNGNVTLTNPVINDARCVMPGTVLSFASGYTSGDTGATPQALDVGEAWTFTCTYAISQADINSGTVANMATGAGQDPSGANIEDEAAIDTALAQTSSWMVTKSTASTPSIAGDTLNYQFLIENTGNVDISSVAVSDTKCAAAPMLVSGDLGGDSILSPPESWTFTCTSIPVTQTEVNDGMVDNAVLVSGSAPSGAPTLPVASDNISTPIVAMPSLTINKTGLAPTVGLGTISDATDVGDTISYSFDIANNGNVTVTTVAVTDSGPTFGGVAGVGNWSGVTCPNTTLQPNQSTTCTAIYTLAQLDIDRAISAGVDSVENSAVANARDPDNGVVASLPDSSTTSIDADSTAQLLKTADAPTFADGSNAELTDPGDTIDFTIELENTGNTTLTNVLVTDNLIVLPNTLTCDATASPSGAAFVNNGSSSLAVGDRVECTATYTIVQADIDAGQVINTASVMADDPAGEQVTGVAEATSPFTQKTSVGLIKTADPLPSMPAPIAGDVVSYTFMLENTGNVSLTEATVSDPQCEMPVGPLTATNGLVVATDVGADGVLAAGETWTFECQYVLKTADIIAGEITNTAMGSGTPPATSGLDAPSATSSALVRAEQNAAITLDKVAGLPTVVGGTEPGVVDVGDTITFIFNIKNTGNLPFDDVTLNDPLITDAPNSGSLSCVLNDGLMTPFMLENDSLPSLGEISCTGTYTLTQTDIDNGDVANTATVIGDPPGAIPPPPEASSGSTVPIPAEPSMTIVKTASVIPPGVMAGSVITYGFTVVNTGNVTITNVAPIDLGPTFNGIAGTNALSAYTPVVAILGPGESQLFEATYTISQIDLDNMATAADPTVAIDNQATVDGEPANGSIPPVPPSKVETGVTPSPELELIKTSSVVAPVAAGSTVTYTFMLSNIGNVTISNPIVTDSKCQNPAGPLSFSNGYVSGDTGVIAQSLDVNEIWEFSCDYVLTQADVDAGTVQNTAMGSGRDPAGKPVDDDSDTGNAGDGGAGGADPTNTALPRIPAWTIDKSTASVPESAGDALEYTFVLTNAGNTSINAITVNDAKCVGDVAVLDTSTDLLGDGVLSPAGASGTPAAEQWRYNCTSDPVTQAEMDAGVVINDVSAVGSAPGGGLLNAEDREMTAVVQTPSMSLVKSAGATTLNNNGSFNQVFNFELKNMGNISLTGVTITDNVPAQFGDCFVGIADAGNVSLNDDAPLGDSLNEANGAAPVIAMVDTLGVGDSVRVSGFTVTLDPNAAGCVFPDLAQNTASGDSNEANDVSDNGADPNVGGADDTGVPTPFTPPTPVPEMGLAKSAAILAFNSDFTFDVEYTVLLRNTGNVDLSSLSLFDDISTQTGAAFSPSTASNSRGGILTGPTVSVLSDALPTGAATPTLNASYDGGAQNVFDGTSGALGVGDTIEVKFSVRIDPTAIDPLPDAFENVASGSAAAPDGSLAEDESNDGSDPSVGSGGDSSPTVVRLEDVAALPIVLGKFDSEQLPDGLIRINWTTQTEVANIGFNLYGKVGNDWQLINSAVIPGNGDSVEIVEYQQVVKSQAEVLAISDIDAHGKESLHGPFVTGQRYGVEANRQTTDWASAIRRRESKKKTQEKIRRAEMVRQNQRRRQRLQSLGDAQ